MRQSVASANQQLPLQTEQSRGGGESEARFEVGVVRAAKTAREFAVSIETKRWNQGRGDDLTVEQGERLSQWIRLSFPRQERSLVIVFFRSRHLQRIAQAQVEGQVRLDLPIGLHKRRAAVPT